MITYTVMKVKENKKKVKSLDPSRRNGGNNKNKKKNITPPPLFLRIIDQGSWILS